MNERQQMKKIETAIGHINFTLNQIRTILHLGRILEEDIDLFQHVTNNDCSFQLRLVKAAKRLAIGVLDDNSADNLDTIRMCMELSKCGLLRRLDELKYQLKQRDLEVGKSLAKCLEGMNASEKAVGMSAIKRYVGQEPAAWWSTKPPLEDRIQALAFAIYEVEAWHVRNERVAKNPYKRGQNRLIVAA